MRTSQIVKWRQCPYRARWFIANKRQIYDTPKCRNAFNSKLARLRAEKEKTDYHYVSIKGVMYESNRTESRY